MMKIRSCLFLSLIVLGCSPEPDAVAPRPEPAPEPKAGPAPVAPPTPKPEGPAGKVHVPAGPFTAGCERQSIYCNDPVAKREVAAFYIDATEVTVEAYGRCVAEKACTEDKLDHMVAPGDDRRAG